MIEVVKVFKIKSDSIWSRLSRISKGQSCHDQDENIPVQRPSVCAASAGYCLPPIQSREVPIKEAFSIPPYPSHKYNIKYKQIANNPIQRNCLLFF